MYVCVVVCVFTFSNLGFGLLGRCLVERVFPRMTYEDYVIKNILEPLQMTDTGFNITSRYIYLHVYSSTYVLITSFSYVSFTVLCRRWQLAMNLMAH